MTCSKNDTARLFPAAGLVVLCLLLAGCPSASNPTQSQSPPPSSPPTTGSSPAGGGAQQSQGGQQGQTSSGGSGSAGSSESSGQGTSGGETPGTGMPGGVADSGDSSNTPGGARGGNADGRPEGDKDPDTGSGAAGESRNGDTGEPGFEDSVAQGGLPDLRDDTSPRSAATNGQRQGSGSGAAGGAESTRGAAGSSGTGNSGVEGSGSSSAAGRSGGDQPAGKTPQGPLTPAEEVAILDAELEQGTGAFDDLILQRQREQRRKAREQASDPGGSGEADSASTGSGVAGGDNPREGHTADAGNYSHGGGIGGVSGGGAIPDNPAKYPPPGDIPDGDDDDVVARQLREAAMREPDPAVRERLWDEYRKYKGIEQ